MRRLIVGTLLLVCAACSLSSEDNFIQGARKDPCDNSIPVCSYTAGCRLTEGENYVEGAFPGFRNFVVPTAGEADISVIFYFRNQVAPGSSESGSDTEFIWYEPGCRDFYTYYLPGIELFRQVGSDRLWTVTQTVYNEGDHMITARSDAMAEFLLKVEIKPLKP